MPKTRTKSKKTTKPKDSCDFTLCTDPETGAVLVKPKGKCPPGTVDSFAAKAATRGIRWAYAQDQDDDEEDE